MKVRTSRLPRWQCWRSLHWETKDRYSFSWHFSPVVKWRWMHWRPPKGRRRQPWSRTFFTTGGWSGIVHRSLWNSRLKLRCRCRSTQGLPSCTWAAATPGPTDQWRVMSDDDWGWRIWGKSRARSRRPGVGKAGRHFALIDEEGYFIGRVGRIGRIKISRLVLYLTVRRLRGLAANVGLRAAVSWKTSADYHSV